MSNRSMLNFDTRLKLRNWCDEHRVDLENNTRPRMARVASEALGFRVTAGNITGMCDVLHIERKYKAKDVDERGAPRLTVRTLARNLLTVVNSLRAIRSGDEDLYGVELELKAMLAPPAEEGKQ